ncbi:galactokinase [Alteromonas aestuariivivens]|uniref:Galactokinase n=1 Tax=Alteromonas aestuariivivens TaxID=1938339 RepID=A0A3D8MDR1_9ALTE|nr:galactokinase [Alteromonas aestuariivivens]RDV27997.1 galactokinase [Alteromonas aestuariivivens]
MTDLALIETKFEQFFNAQPQVMVHSPGRVNLIGEHTDYNEGFVFPAAINFGTWVAGSKTDDNQVHAVAMDYDDQTNQFAIDNIETDNSTPWANYIRGVYKVLKEAYPQVGGAKLVITGNVPQGAGLSSSASFEVAILKAFRDLYQLDLDGVQAALLGQKAENTFVGCSCGIMDQLISAMGQEGKAMLLDCLSLDMQHITVPESLSIMIINSNVKRGLVDSEYNQRREQCEEAARLMGINSLREADMALLESNRIVLSEVVYRRAKHVITENQRTLDMYHALSKGDIQNVSKLMAESHASMREDFEITVNEIDYLVNIVSDVLSQQGGVRMTGGGFGGCVVALIPKELEHTITEVVESAYFDHTGYRPSIYICSATGGAFA